MTAQGALVEHEPDNRALSNRTEQAPQGIAPMVQMVADGKLTIDQLDHLMALQERHEAAEAKRQYNTAMAHFRAEVPPALRDGKGQNNKYATFGSVMSAINAPLGNNGFNVEFDHDQDIDKNTLKVICTITHSGGHSTSTSLTVRVQKLGSANEVQSLGGNVSYLKRYCVSSLTGLATEDDDGASHQASKPPEIPRIEEKQESILVDLLAAIEVLRPGYTARWTNHYAGEHGTSDTPLGVSLPANRLKHVLDELNGHLRNYKAQEAENADS